MYLFRTSVLWNRPRHLYVDLSSAGDLLRAEQKKNDSKYAEMIQTCIREGTIVPMEVTIKLLENAMTKTLESRTGEPGWEGGRGRFLIDGFPRKMDQALKFDETVSSYFLVRFIDRIPIY